MYVCLQVHIYMYRLYGGIDTWVEHCAGACVTEYSFRVLMAGPTAGVKQLRGVMQLCYSWLRRVEGHSLTIQCSLLLSSNTSTRQETLQDNVALCIVECASNFEVNRIPHDIQTHFTKLDIVWNSVYFILLSNPPISVHKLSNTAPLWLNEGTPGGAVFTGRQFFGRVVNPG